MELTGQYRIRARVRVWLEPSDTVDRMPRVKTARKEQSILEAASRVFARRPFHEVLIDDIASDARIGKGTIYRYFETKDELYFATILFGIDNLADALTRILPQVTTPSARLERIAKEILSFFWDRRYIYPLLQRDPEHAERQTVMMKRREPILRLVQETILAGIERREFRGIDAHIGAEFFLGMVRSAHLFRAEDETLDELVFQVMSIFLGGVKREEE
jgi:AcrR family transcriptional regulator